MMFFHTILPIKQSFFQIPLKAALNADVKHLKRAEQQSYPILSSRKSNFIFLQIQFRRQPENFGNAVSGQFHRRSHAGTGNILAVVGITCMSGNRKAGAELSGFEKMSVYHDIMR